MSGVVAGNFFETVTRVFHSEEEVHLDLVLSTGELSITNAVSEAVKSLDSNIEEILGVGASTSHFDTEETGVSEVGVDGFDTVEESVSLNSFVGAARAGLAEGLVRAEDFSCEGESVDIFVTPWDRLESDLN